MIRIIHLFIVLIALTITNSFSINSVSPLDQTTSVIHIGVQPAYAASDEETLWTCTCRLYSDRNDTYKERWNGTVRFGLDSSFWMRWGAEAMAAEKCENETKNVQCAFCSCSNPR